MKTIISDYDRICEYCAGEIKRLVSGKNNAVLAFSPEECLYGVFERLAFYCKKGEIDFSGVKILSTCELSGSHTLGDIIRRRLIDNINADEKNVFLLCDDNFTDYDALISSLGGIDALFTGIGSNAQLAFNECGTAFNSNTHISKLSTLTQKEYCLDASDRGLTMGIKTVTDAKTIYVTAVGADKADAVFRMLYARNDTATPAAFLQIPLNVTVLADADASSKL